MGKLSPAAAKLERSFELFTLSPSIERAFDVAERLIECSVRHVFEHIGSSTAQLECLYEFAKTQGYISDPRAAMFCNIAQLIQQFSTMIAASPAAQIEYYLTKWSYSKSEDYARRVRELVRANQHLAIKEFIRSRPDLLPVLGEIH